MLPVSRVFHHAVSPPFLEVNGRKTRWSIFPPKRHEPARWPVPTHLDPGHGDHSHRATSRTERPERRPCLGYLEVEQLRERERTRPGCERAGIDGGLQQARRIEVGNRFRTGSQGHDAQELPASRLIGNEGIWPARNPEVSE
jgi:hypothetical protein